MKAILDQLVSEGKSARINEKHRCVDVLDDDGCIIEQHYPEFSSTKKGRRGKFVPVPEGEGNYILTYVDYDKKCYTDDNHTIKYVNKTNKDKRNMVQSSDNVFNEIKKAIQHDIDSGADYTDIDDYLNRLHIKGIINGKEFSTLINWAATKVPELL